MLHLLRPEVKVSKAEFCITEHHRETSVLDQHYPPSAFARPNAATCALPLITIAQGDNECGDS